MIRTLIIDDETLARQRIRQLLEQYQQQVLVIGECKSGTEALEAIQNSKPDLIFLDIQMQDLNGFEVLRKLPSEVLPSIIFVTAYDQYALQAFEYYALDYILKPINEERFDQSLNRIIMHLQKNRTDPSSSMLNTLLRVLQNETEFKTPEVEEKLVVRQANKIYFLEKASIKYIEASGYYAEVYTADRKYLLRESLYSLLHRLEVSYFVRIHRSTIINTNFLDQINSIGYGDVEVTMKDNRVFRVSKSYKEDFYRRMGLH